MLLKLKDVMKDVKRKRGLKSNDLKPRKGNVVLLLFAK